MAHLFEDSRVILELEATAQQVLMEAGDAKGVIYRKGDRDIEVRGQAVALGANAIFNPWLLQRSGFKHPFWANALLNKHQSLLLLILTGWTTSKVVQV